MIFATETLFLRTLFIAVLDNRMPFTFLIPPGSSLYMNGGRDSRPCCILPVPHSRTTLRNSINSSTRGVIFGAACFLGLSLKDSCPRWFARFVHPVVVCRDTPNAFETKVLFFSSLTLFTSHARTWGRSLVVGSPVPGLNFWDNTPYKERDKSVNLTGLLNIMC